MSACAQSSGPGGPLFLLAARSRVEVSVHSHAPERSPGLTSIAAPHCRPQIAGEGEHFEGEALSEGRGGKGVAALLNADCARPTLRLHRLNQQLAIADAMPGVHTQQWGGPPCSSAVFHPVDLRNPPGYGDGATRGPFLNRVRLRIEQRANT